MQPWSEAIAELVVLAMVVTYVIGTLRHWELRIELPPGWLPAALFVALVVFQAVAPHSLDPHATRREALELLAVAAVFLVCYNTYRTRPQTERALWTMIAMGTVLSIFGIVQRVTWNGRLYWIGPESPGWTFGPFVNRTHFAGLMVIVVPAALAFGLASNRARQRPRWIQNWRDRLREWNSAEAGPTRLIPVLVLVMGGAALVSGSRGGFVALLTTLLAMTLGSVTRRRSLTGQAARVAVATALIILVGLWIGGDIFRGTIERLAQEVGQGTQSERLWIWTDALRLSHSAPVLGTGLGTFGIAYPSVRTIRMPLVYSHAESDWIQLLTDTGILGLGLLVTAGTTLALSLLHRYRDAESRCVRLLSLAAFVALIGTAIQGIANYNLPLMSNLVYLAMVVVVSGPHQSVDAEPSPS